ncbi:hypothetical protein D3C85_693550 [compost metagenome]
MCEPDLQVQTTQLSRSQMLHCRANPSGSCEVPFLVRSPCIQLDLPCLSVRHGRHRPDVHCRRRAGLDHLGGAPWCRCRQLPADHSRCPRHRHHQAPGLARGGCRGRSRVDHRSGNRRRRRGIRSGGRGEIPAVLAGQAVGHCHLRPSGTGAAADGGGGDSRAWGDGDGRGRHGRQA